MLDKHLKDVCLSKEDIMTKEELSKLYHLNREIRQLDDRIKEIEACIGSKAQVITGMPRGGTFDWTDKMAEMADMKELIKLKREQCWYELNRLNRYIFSVDDTLIRQILTLRYINGLTWEQIGFSLNYSWETVRKKHDTWLKNTN